MRQLKQVKTGQEIELQSGGPIRTYVNTGIRCSDEEAKAAYMVQENIRREQEAQELAQLNQAIDIEMKRIQRRP